MSTGNDRVSTWLKSNRADATQEWLAADIQRVTGWRITRDRYSKYESGSLAIGKQTLKHFTDYWASRGVGGPDDMGSVVDVTPPATDPALIAALTAQTAAITRLVERLDSLASQAIREGVLDALREAGLDPAVGESQDEPPGGPRG